MNERQRLFLVQARTDYAVFELLRKRAELPHCHSLHYLQMATEMLGKAHAWRHGRPLNTHRAFAGFVRGLSKNREAQRQLGYVGRNENWWQLIRKSGPLAEAVEDLAPALTPDGPNPEYPWPRDEPVNAPAEHAFGLWRDLQGTAPGRRFLDLLTRLFDVADAYL